MINTLLDCLRSMDLSSYTEDDINDILYDRDAEEFDSEWCRVDSEIEALKDNNNYTDENQNEHDVICKKAFFIIEEKVSSELSDDFGLIYDSIATDYHDAWLSKLIEVYQNGRIPSGKL